MTTPVRLSPKFLADLNKVHTAMRPQPLSAAFLSDLRKVYGALPTASDANLHFLAERFDKWRRATREFVRAHLQELDKDDPLLCRISLFRTMDAGRLETAHTQTLAWLLDPTKDEELGFGAALMASLLERLTGRVPFDRLRVESVVPEHPLDGSAGKGRLDVLATGEWECVGECVRWMLVIEAKIDAGEGEGQLDKYDKWIEAHAGGRKIYRVFLTADGRPSESVSDEWTALSFLQLVQTFQKVYRKLKKARGFHFLRFYLAGVLQDICGWPRIMTADAPDPYAVASYLRTIHGSHSGGTSDERTR